VRAPERRAGELVAARLGLDFPPRRSADLERGVGRAARRAGARSVPEYLARLEPEPADSAAWQHLAAELTVGESYFFRDRAALDALADQVLAPLIAERRAKGRLRLRLWSAGCSTGEEPYTLAMLLHRLLPDRADWELTILATDVDLAALETARLGEYRQWSLRETPVWARSAHLIRHGRERFEVASAIREMVTFAPHNLVRPAGAPAGSGMMDAILCRNVLMYFTREAQQATARMLRHSLAKGGWLFVSPAEASTELLHPLVPVRFPGAVLYLREEPAQAVVREHPPARPEQPPPRTVDRAQAAADAGRLDAAIELCRAALGEDGLDGEAHLLLATVHGERDETAAAIASARAAVYAAPESPQAHFVLGAQLLRAGEPARARRSMETVAALLSTTPASRRVGAGDLTADTMLAAARAHLAMAT